MKDDRLSSGLARNTVWNLTGQIAPLAVGLVAIPPLIQRLGTERFGILALVWIAIGYLSLFDLGIGRALTHLVAERRGRGATGEAGVMAWTGLALMMLTGLAVSGTLALATPWLVGHALNVPPELASETIGGFYLVCLALPGVIASAGLRGVLEGWERFDLTNGVRLLVSSLTYLAPLGASLLAPNLVAVVASLAVVRTAGALAFLLLCAKVVPGFGLVPKIDFSKSRELLQIGGWMAVSNAVSPVLVNLDRFVIGSVLTMSDVAYYATPYEVVTKLLVLPAAISSVLFPAFSRTYAGRPEATARLFLRAVQGSFFLLFPLVFGVVVLAPELLRVWVGAEFAQNSSGVAKLLAIGVLINGLAHIPFVLVQGAGRADLTGKLHLLELPLYVVLLWWLTGNYGVIGAGLAWTARVTVDGAVLFGMSLGLLNGRANLLVQIGKLAGAAAVLVSGAFLVSSLVAKSVFLVCGVLGFVAVFWHYGLEDETRQLLKGYRFRRPGGELPSREGPGIRR